MYMYKPGNIEFKQVIQDIIDNETECLVGCSTKNTYTYDTNDGCH